MKNWSTTLHFLFGALLLAVLPLIASAYPVVTPYALDHGPLTTLRR